MPMVVTAAVSVRAAARRRRFVFMRVPLSFL
jgi:hypothetical protein